MIPESSQSILDAATLLAEAQSVVCMTGAGASAESGIPTFRDAVDSLWENAHPEDLASIEGWHRDCDKVWRFYLWRRQKANECRPNPGHFALAELQDVLADFTLITQNVDGLDIVAGSRGVLMLHGSLWINRCTSCAYETEDPRIEFDAPPLCTKCGALTRPGVVWFGESLPQDVWVQADQACRRCDVMMVVGTSSVVYPAAGLSQWAKQVGATIIEINPNATPLSTEADIVIPETSGSALPALLEQLLSIQLQKNRT